MARRHTLSDEERQAIAIRVKRWLEEDRSPVAAKARALGEGANRSFSATSIIHASAGKAGPEFTQHLERYLGENLSQWIREMHEPPVLEASGERPVARPERYPSIEIVFARARADNVSERILDAARLRLGALKSDEGPTEVEVMHAIADEMREVRRLGRFLKEATELDDDLDGPPKAGGKRK